ncbi:MAG: polyketide synthase dehydratase domain-containing protein, partial [Phycisphaerales bacterium]
YPPSADIFPSPFFSDEEEQAAERRLWKIERAVEAVLTADGAMFTLLRRLGVKPDMIAGHSGGEWIAIAAAGVVDIDEFVASMDRLDGMYRKLAEDVSIPRMTMLAVGAGREEVARLAAQIDRAVHIANDNCPHQVVVVVEPKDAETVIKHLRSRGVFVEQLPYDRGYHTWAFTYICEPLRGYFESLGIRGPETTLYSCTTAKPYPTDPAKVVDLVANTFARPQLFRETVEAMYAAGARVFLEVGPRGNLTAFTDDILRGRPRVAIAADQPRRSGIVALNHMVGMLAALHVPLEFTHLYSRRSLRRLTFDPEADRPVDDDATPGTMQVSLCYPKLELVQRPESCSAGSSASSVPTVEQAEPVVPGSVEALDLLESGVADYTPQHADPQALPTEVRTAKDGSPPASVSAAMQEHLRMMERFLETQEEVMRAYLEARSPGEASVALPVSPPSEVASITSTPAVAAEEKAEPAARSLEDTLVAIVSEKTGYPPDMLSLDLDMEADLGIDSIKRIEILGALQETDGNALPASEIDLEQVAKLKSLRQVIEFLENLEGLSSPPDDIRSTPLPDAGALAFSGKVVSHTPGSEIVVLREVEPEQDLYLNDHCLDPQVTESDQQRDVLAVIPLTVSLEMMAEVAALLVPGREVIGAKGIQAGKWIEVGKGGPKVELTITAHTGSSGRSGGLTYNEVRAAIHHRRTEDPDAAPDAQPVVEGTIVFADSFPSAPAGELSDLKNRRRPANTAEQMYAQRRMFHGPRFQGVVSLDEVGEDGLVARLEVLPTDNLLRSKESPCFHVDPFLLDAAGQLVGYWPVEYFDQGFVLFPIRLHELALYRENLKPGERAVCQLRIRQVSQRQVRADMEIIAPDGRLWMRLRGWEDWRFYWAPNFYDFWRFPNKGMLSERVELPLPESCRDVECLRMKPFEEIRTRIWETLWAHLILSRRELAQYGDMTDDDRRKEWLFGRAVAKDAVRTWVKRHYGLDLYPADVEIDNDEHGAPHGGGRWVSRIGVAPQLTLSHKGTVAVAAAGRRALGIDLERIEARDSGFDALVFDESELRLFSKLNGDNRAEWVTRAWCAKEAASKATGRGLSDGPRVMVVNSIDPGPGQLVVSRREPSPGRRPEDVARQFMVHSIRDGEFVIALAVDEGNSGEGG